MGLSFKILLVTLDICAVLWFFEWAAACRSVRVKPRVTKRYPRYPG